MSGYTKEIQEIVGTSYNALGTESLIQHSDLFLDSDDSDWKPDKARRRSRTAPDRVSAEELRIMKLIGDTPHGPAGIKPQILSCGHPDRIKGKCLQMLREYEDDPENNSTALTALQLILKLPTTLKPIPISLSNTYEQTTEFLQQAWDYMQSQVYGQERAKSEIIEYLVSRLLTGGDGRQPRILGLVGPPGVGKTSLAIHGIAKVMGVPFYQISIGGLRDVTYFSGSMRCWKGAHQGKFTDILIKEGCLNPIIYVDELDKVSAETAQDIYGLLTHVADSNTNKHIQDHYLGIDLDLSNVTFIFSYNDPTVLPLPLRDRIKEIHLNGFNQEEKIDMARDFIIPACLAEYGLSNRDIVFNNETIAYTNKTIQTLVGQAEISGVRHLNKGYQSLIGKIMVNVVCNQNGYRALRGGKGGGKMRKARSAKFMPFYRQIQLPYHVKIADIDYYLIS